jgi:translocator assembly and maintenance protein 41
VGGAIFLISAKMDFRRLLAHFPPTTYSFAYGSGVFQQAGYDKGAALLVGAAASPAPLVPRDPTREPPMLDFIFAVDDPVAWHSANASLNRGHYAGLGALLPPSLIAAVQESGPGGIWYNTMVPIPESALADWPAGTIRPLMKYGVVATATLGADCTQWTSLYAAGRLHKPVLTIHDGAPTAVHAAMRQNLRQALSAALLCLPASFTPEQLYLAIAGLSYAGDWRMTFGEHPEKVANIVRPNVGGFHALYAPLLATSFPLVRAEYGEDGGRGGALPSLFAQDVSADAQLALGLSLPLRLQRLMADSWWAGRATSSSARPLLDAGMAAARHSSSLSRARQQALAPPLLGEDMGSMARHAVRDPRVSAFWEALLRSTSAARRSGQCVPAAAVAPHLRPAMASIVSASARAQSIKGVLTAGPLKAAQYAASKLRKYFAAVLK